MNKIYLLCIFVISAFCDIKDKGGNIKESIKARKNDINEIKEDISNYNFGNDPLLKQIYDIGYQSFESSASIYIYNQILDKDLPNLSKQMLLDVGLPSISDSFILSGLKYFGVVSVTFNLISIPETNRAKIFVVLGQKKSFLPHVDVGDYMVVDFTQDFKLFEKYTQQKYMDWCAGFSYICQGSETIGYHSDRLDNKQVMLMNQFISVLLYEKLVDYYGI